MDLTRLHSQQGRQHAAVRCKPAPPLPGPEHTGGREPCRATAQVGARWAGLVADDPRDRPRGGAGGRQPPRAEPRPRAAVTPGPVRPAPQLLSGHPASVGPWDDGGGLPLDHHAARLLDGPLRPRLRVATPPIGHPPGRGPRSAPAPNRRPRPLPPHRPPGPWGAAGSPGAHGIRPAPRAGHRPDPRAVAAHHDQPQAIEPAPPPLLLAAPPRPDQPAWRPGRLEAAVVAHPGPWPPTPEGRALVLDRRPPGGQPILRPARPRSPPRGLGPGAQICPGTCVSQQRPRVSSSVVRHPHPVGHRTPQMCPSRCPPACSRPSTSTPRVAGRPRSFRACAQACRGRGARACAPWSRARDVWRRRGVAWSARRGAWDRVPMGTSGGVGFAGRTGAHGLTWMSFQERSPSHSPMAAVDWTSVMKRKSQSYNRG